jgi:hypothetical protein
MVEAIIKDSHFPGKHIFFAPPFMILCTARDTMHAAGVPVMYKVGLIHILSDCSLLTFWLVFLITIHIQ